MAYLTFSDRINTCIKASGGVAHFTSCLNALYQLQPQDVVTDFKELFSFIRTRLRKRALIFVLTQLDDPIAAEQLAASIQIVARQHLVVVGTLNPAWVQPIFSKTEVHQTAELYRHLAGHLVWQKQASIHEALSQYGIQWISLENEQMVTQLISKYTSLKQKQRI